MRIVSIDEVDYEEFMSFGSIMVLGGVDRGKSTFIKNLANFLLKRVF